MELRQLRVFLTVAAERSFTRAAEKLFLTQSAVSTSVQVLEREIGVTLIDRTVQPISLTLAGQAFLDYARQTVVAAETAVQVARQEVGGVVTFGFINARRSNVPTVPGMIATFTKAYPAVTVTGRHIGGSLRAAEQVRDGHLDCALISLGGNSMPGVRTRPLWSEPIVFVCNRSHPLASNASVTVADLTQQVMVSLPPTWGVPMTVETWLQQQGASLEFEHVVNGHAALLDFVSEGAASVLLPVSFLPDDPRLAAVSVEPPLMFTTQLATPQHRSASPASTAFIAWVQDRVRRHLAETATGDEGIE